jgi:hypothetical protein
MAVSSTGLFAFPDIDAFSSEKNERQSRITARKIFIIDQRR